jgi:hypothetical protein
MTTAIFSIISVLLGACVSIIVVHLNDRKETRRRLEASRRELRKSEHDHYRRVHSDALTAARNYMHALSDYAGFEHRRRTSTLGRVVIGKAELTKRLIATDREMAHQESVMNLSDNSRAYNSYKELTKSVRLFRRLIDEGNPATGLAPEDVHPECEEWRSAYKAYESSRGDFVKGALSHLKELVSPDTDRASAGLSTADAPGAAPEVSATATRP